MALPNYDHMYKQLFNSITDAIPVLEELLEDLKQAQRDTEELFIESGEPKLLVLPMPSDETEEKERLP